MIGGLTNHLWQSTVFAIAAGLLTLALRGNRAAVRYGVWLATSAKFLVPFSVLMLLGRVFERGAIPAASAPAPVALATAMLEFSEPFPATFAVPDDSRNWTAIAIFGMWL